jgi:hypothetical protein
MNPEEIVLALSDLSEDSGSETLSLLDFSCDEIGDPDFCIEDLDESSNSESSVSSDEENENDLEGLVF